MTAPVSDDALIALAQHRFDQAERNGATGEDCRELRDIFPAVLQRLCEKVEITRNLLSIERVDFGDPKAWERMAAAVNRNDSEDQLQLALTHL
ncbi:hypothetical protein [Novosphingobium sp. BL-52-GroH]|uniref:hypothetical protein n=1 Tax=Novosphingobium sp. BL-52-GroH TaxID=3349877 RepID=UPI00384F2E43